MKHEIQIAMGLSIKDDIEQALEPAKHLLVGGVKAGDTKIIWDPANVDEAAAAKATYDKLLGKGFTAFMVRGDGERGGKMTEWNPEAGKVIMIPRIAGGC